MLKFILKLFRALNSSGKSWQLSTSVVLAMFAGFLPTSSLILLDILFIVLILNINFGLFILFFAIFGGIGYIFDPMFESIGYALLTNESFDAVFTYMYNSVLFMWSGFNYTLVAGSMTVSALLALPMFFILNRLITLYRVQIGQRLNEWKFTKWMNLFNEELKSTSVFRWWGLCVFAGLFALISIFIIFVFDPLAKIAAEKSLSYSLQTEVSIKDLSTNFSSLSVNLSGVEVADKDKLTHNLVQVDNVSFDLDFSALIEKKAMIESLKINALAFNEKRKSPAEPYDSSYVPIVSESKEAIKSVSMNIANPFEIPSVDEILNKEELKSVTQAQKLRKDIEQTKEKWIKVSSDIKSANEVDKIKADALKLQNSFKGVDISKIASLKNDVESLKKRIENLKSKYTKLQKEFNADKDRLQKQIYELKNLPIQDIERLKKKYSFDSSGGANLIGTLINKELDVYVKKGLEYYEMIRPYLDDASKEKPQDIKPPRGEGRWIKYTNLSRVPELVIKDARINLKLKDDELNINVKDLSSNQKLYNKPMRLHADAKGKLYEHIAADVVDDRRDGAKTDFDIRTTGFKTSELNLKALNMKDILTDANIKGTLKEMDIDAKTNLSVKSVKLEMPSQKIVNDLLAGVSNFNVDISLSGDVKKPDITVKNNLDKQLSSGMKSLVSNATKGFEKDLTSGIMKKAGSSSKGLSADLGDISSLLSSQQSALGGINTNFSSGGSGLLKKFF